MEILAGTSSTDGRTPFRFGRSVGLVLGRSDRSPRLRRRRGHRDSACCSDSVEHRNSCHWDTGETWERWLHRLACSGDCDPRHWARSIRVDGNLQRRGDNWPQGRSTVRARSATRLAKFRSFHLHVRSAAPHAVPRQRHGLRPSQSLDALTRPTDIVCLGPSGRNRRRGPLVSCLSARRRRGRKSASADEIGPATLALIAFRKRHVQRSRTGTLRVTIGLWDRADVTAGEPLTIIFVLFRSGTLGTSKKSLRHRRSGNPYPA